MGGAIGFKKMTLYFAVTIIFLFIVNKSSGISFTCSNTSCPGSEVTFICSVTSPTLIFTVYPNNGSDSLGFTVSKILPLGINSKGASETNGDFTVVFTDDNNGVTSEIQFTANESLDKWIIRCADGGSTENKNCTIHITNPPSNVPTIVNTSVIDCHSMNISWVYDSEDDEISVEKYMIDVEPPPEDGSCKGGTCNTNNSFYILTKLEYSLSYSIRVKAINCAGNGNYSNKEIKVLSVGYVPPPTSLSTSVLTSCDALNITWRHSSYTGVAEDTLKYHLEIDSEPYTTYNTSYVIDKLECGVSYTISLSAAVCEKEMSESVNTSKLIYTMIESPPAIQNLELKACDNATSSVILQWISPDTSSNEVPIVSYNIMITPTPNVSGICSDGGCTVNDTDTSVSISGLQYGVNHTIEIVPVNYCNQTGSPNVVHCKPTQDLEDSTTSTQKTSCISIGVFAGIAVTLSLFTAILTASITSVLMWCVCIRNKNRNRQTNNNMTMVPQLMYEEISSTSNKKQDIQMSSNLAYGPTTIAARPS